MTFALGQLDQWLLALTNDKNVGKTSGELLALVVFDVDNLVRTGVVFNVHECADTTDVVSALDEDSGSIFEFNNAVDLASLKVKLNAFKKVLNIIFI